MANDDWIDRAEQELELGAQTLAGFRLQRPRSAPRLSIPAEPQSTDEPLPFLDVAAWDDAPVPEREWAVPDDIPAKNVTLLTGHGGGGKTTLAAQLCAATALGRDWLTRLPQPGKAMMVCCEDEADELHRRFDRIANYYGVSFGDLARGGLYPMSLAGRDAVLAVATEAAWSARRRCSIGSARRLSRSGHG